jgi:uncharacterized protein YeaO (DUF488 family)
MSDLEARAPMIDDEPEGGGPPCWAHMFEDHPTPDVRLRRAYEPATPEDGTRILVDRLWPRGVSKKEAALDAWAKDVAPSTELRRWFGHDPDRWEEFTRRYRKELNAHPEALQPLLDAAAKGPLTLIYGARDTEHNEAVVLQHVIEERLAKY